MSLNPTLGHLYHDYSITNSYTVLDAKEKMKTREINARETKYLQKYTRSLDKAKRICQNKNAWEQRNIKKQLASIKTKTMSLDKGLKKESQRLQLFDDVLNDNTSTKSEPTNFMKARRLPKPTLRNNFVSNKSLFSQSYIEQITSAKQQEINTSNNDLNGYNQNKQLPSKTTKLLRKADSVTKSLHKLYTKDLERRWKDTNRTILDILSNESDEELERALFVLRGTHAGTLIEDILRERAWERRARSESYERIYWSSSSAGSNGQERDPVFVTEINIKDRTERMKVQQKKPIAMTTTNESKVPEQQSFKDNVKGVSNGIKNSNNLERKISEDKRTVPFDVYNHSVSELFTDGLKLNANEGSSKANFTGLQSIKLQSLSSSAIPILSGVQGNETRQWINVGDIRLDLNISERDHPDSVSSTIANPSEQEYVPMLKWREIFRTPAVWKQNRRVLQTVKKSKSVSLVKVHGQYRQTMLK